MEKVGFERVVLVTTGKKGENELYKLTKKEL